MWVLLTPIILFIILMILLYVPPVQNLIRKQATAIASDATGMDISVERIDLRFPLNLLVRGVLVVQPADSAVDVQHPRYLAESWKFERTGTGMAFTQRESGGG